MRLRSPGVGEPEDAGVLSFEGRPVPKVASDSVASALVAAGELGVRRDERGGLRGVWCGMGVCHECSVRVDGQDARLACTTSARAAQEAQIQPVRRSLPGQGVLPSHEELAPDVLVVGAGPSGLVAARDLARGGARVVLVDERKTLGGQYFKQPDAAFPVREGELDAQFTRGRQLIEQVGAAGVQVLLGTTVWAAFAPDEFLGRGDGTRWRIRPDRVVLATGAYERGVPLPGWTLPGVMTTGAGQTLVRSYQVAPGSHVLVAGNGPLNMQLAAELVRGGAHVVGLVEAARPFSPGRLASGARMAASSPDLVRDGAAYLATLARRRVPVLTGAVVERLDGDPQSGVREATVARLDDEGRATGRRRRFDVDAVCLGYGFLPTHDLARSLGCRHEYDPRRGELRTVTDESGRTSLPTVWSVGDGAGVRGAKFAQAQGALAAAAVLDDLYGGSVRSSRSALRTTRRHLSFQRGLNRMFAAPVLTDQLADPQTIVCRCEGVGHADIVAAMTEGGSAPGSVKRVTRAGMGKCQGRYCGPVLMSLHARGAGAPISERSGFAPQAPVRPVPLGDVAAAEEEKR
jgi:NADPH-dependent 2,4-dienoyl-CoA reductase/sulfur reductase-like enzyme